MKFEEKFRLEYSEEQGQWHCNRGLDEPETNSYLKLFEKCTDLQMYAFTAFVEKKELQKFTKKEILEQVDSFNIFMKNLKKFNLTIEKL